MQGQTDAHDLVVGAFVCWVGRPGFDSSSLQNLRSVLGFKEVGFYWDSDKW